MIQTPCPGYYRGLASAIGRGPNARPWGIPPRYLGRLPGTPAIAFEGGAPPDPRFVALTTALGSAFGVPPGTSFDEIWAPVTTMGISIAQLQAEALARDFRIEPFGAWLAQMGADWQATNLEPLAAQLEACALDGDMLGAMSAFAGAWYDQHGRDPLGPGLRWPADERAALEATLAEFCPQADPPPFVPAELTPPEPEKKTPVLAYVAGGVGLLGLVGAGIYYGTRKRR